MAFWQAVVIAGIGTLLGAAIGLLPSLALAIPPQLAAASGTPVPASGLPDFAPPWLQLGLTAAALPLLIAIGSWLTAGRRRIAVRRAA